MTRVEAVSEFLQSIMHSMTNSNQPTQQLLARHYPNIQSQQMPNIMSQQQVPNIMSQQRSSPKAQPVAPTSTSSQSQPDSHSQSNSDLHFYTLKNLILHKQARISTPIFTVILPYRSVYVCDMSTQSLSHYEGTSKFEDVYSAIEITNTTNQVWTTAPITIFTNGSFVSQDSMTYTALNSPNTIHLTKALDVNVSHEEYETKDKGTEHWRSTSFRLTLISGRYAIRHSKIEPITLIIKLKYEGKFVSSSTAPKKNTHSTTFYSPNVTTNLYWEITVPVGESFSMTYQRLMLT